MATDKIRLAVCALVWAPTWAMSAGVTKVKGRTACVRRCERIRAGCVNDCEKATPGDPDELRGCGQDHNQCRTACEEPRGR